MFFDHLKEEAGLVIICIILLISELTYFVSGQVLSMTSYTHSAGWGYTEAAGVGGNLLSEYQHLFYYQ